MAITINVNGVNSGGGNNNQPPTNPTPPTPPSPTPQPPVQPQQQPNVGQRDVKFTVVSGGEQQTHSQQQSIAQQQPTPASSRNGNVGNQQPNAAPTNNQRQQSTYTQPIRYQRPDFSQYRTSSQQRVNTPMPTSDRLVNDVRAEISRRGIILVPGTQNFSTLLNTMHQNQRASLMGQIDNQYERKMTDIDNRKDELMYEIKGRLDASRNSELANTSDPITIKNINERYDRLMDREEGRVDRYFAGQYDAVEQEHADQTAEAEQRLTEALQRLTEELSQGNKDSYLNNLRDKYKEQIWRRDNAGTEEEVREASREAAKIQERMQRAMSGGPSPTASRLVGTAAGIITTGANMAMQLDRIGIKEDYVGFDMASSVLNGNATAAIRQQNAIDEQTNSAWGMGLGAIGGMAAGAAAGSAIGGVGAIPGAVVGLILGAIGTGIGAAAGAGVAHLANRSMLVEDERTKVADLWKQEESRLMGFNDLVMLTRGRFTNPNDIAGIRNTYAERSGERDWKEPEEESTGISDGTAAGGVISDIVSGHHDVWRRSASQLDLYDLGYTAPEFAQQVSRRIKQRGFVGRYAEEDALTSDALERVFSMNSGALGQLSKYDRFGKNDANQDFTNLVFTLDRLGTTGMRNGQWARSDEFAGYMTQLQGSQRSTFLTVDNERAGRQIATGQRIFGDKFGAEAMQGIQAVNNQVQNPGGGFQQTLLYDVIQELYPDTRGRIDKIIQAQYDPKKQNQIQQEFAKRVQSIYGGVDTTSGFLAMQDVYGIENPNILMPIARQLTKKGGLEAQQLDKSHKASDEAAVLNNGYTPEISQRMNAMADQQMKSLLHYQETITGVVQNILDKLETSIAEKLDEAVDNLK